MKHIYNFGFELVLSFSLLALPPGAQSSAKNQDQSNAQGQSSSGSGSSLGDYARQIRKDRGQGKTKPRVFDNDNLPKQDKLSIIGEPLPPADKSAEAKPTESKGTAPAAGEAKTSSETKTKATTETKTETKTDTRSAETEAAERQAAWKQWQEQIKAQRDQIELLQRELDVLQREYQIRVAAFYADAGNRLRNSGAWDKEDADYKQQIAAKQNALDEAKQKLDDIQEKARQAGVPTSVREP
jgi:hypothetical protein